MKCKKNNKCFWVAAGKSDREVSSTCQSMFQNNTRFIRELSGKNNSK